MWFCEPCKDNNISGIRLLRTIVEQGWRRLVWAIINNRRAPLLIADHSQNGFADKMKTHLTQIMSAPISKSFNKLHVYIAWVFHFTNEREDGKSKILLDCFEIHNFQWEKKTYFWRGWVGKFLFAEVKQANSFPSQWGCANFTRHPDISAVRWKTSENCEIFLTFLLYVIAPALKKGKEKF